jgi:glucokinase
VSTRGTALGIDVGGTRIKWALLDSAEVVRRGDVPTPRAGGEELVDQISQLVHTIGADLAVGLAMPGLVDTVRRETLFIPNIPGRWEHYPIAQQVEARANGTPVQLLNDARAFAYAEFHLGSGRGCTDAVFIVIGTGVGGALAQAGRIVIGEIDCIPEMGHVAVETHGERCGCGAIGCLETVASASAVVAQSVRAVLTGQSAVLTELCGGRVANLTAEIVAKAADADDPWAKAAFERAGTYIGMAAASTCVLLNTPNVILGGGLSGAFHHLVPALEHVIAERASITGPVRVLKAALGSHAGSIGAALFAQHRSANRSDVPGTHLHTTERDQA